MVTYKQRAIKKLKKMQRETEGFIRVLNNPRHPNNEGLSTSQIAELLNSEKVLRETWPVIIRTLSEIKE